MTRKLLIALAASAIFTIIVAAVNPPHLDRVIALWVTLVAGYLAWHKVPRVPTPELDGCGCTEAELDRLADVVAETLLAGRRTTAGCDAALADLDRVLPKEVRAA
jgi:hypothetical protein